MSTTPCPQRDLAVGWALRALEPEEEARVAAHLPLCAECREQVEATHHTAALLATATPQLDPPARLRASILEAARAAGPAQAPAPARAPSTPVLRSVVPAPSRTARPRRALVAAAAVLVLAVGAVAGWAGSQLGSGSAGSGAAVAQGSDSVARDLASPGTRQVVLSAEGSSTPVAVLLTASDHELVLPVDMPALDEGQSFWMWGVDARGVPVPLGDVVEATDASAAALGARQVNALPAAGADYTTYAMSVEPGDGVPTVPTTVVASGQVRA